MTIRKEVRDAIVELEHCEDDKSMLAVSRKIKDSITALTKEELAFLRSEYIEIKRALKIVVLWEERIDHE